MPTQWWAMEERREKTRLGSPRAWWDRPGTVMRQDEYSQVRDRCRRCLWWGELLSMPWPRAMARVLTTQNKEMFRTLNQHQEEREDRRPGLAEVWEDRWGERQMSVWTEWEMIRPPGGWVPFHVQGPGRRETEEKHILSPLEVLYPSPYLEHRNSMSTVLGHWDLDRSFTPLHTPPHSHPHTRTRTCL